MTQQTKLIGIAAIVIVVGASLGTATYLARRQKPLPQVPETPVVIAPPQIAPVPATPSAPEPPPQQPYGEALKFRQPAFLTTAKDLKPEWTVDITGPERVRHIGFEDFFGIRGVEHMASKLDASSMLYLESAKTGEFLVTGSVWIGGDLYNTALFFSPCVDMCMSDQLDFVLIDESRNIVLVPTASEYASTPSLAFFTPAPNVSVIFPSFPKTLTLTNGITLRQTQRCAGFGECGTYTFRQEQSADDPYVLVGTTEDRVQVFKNHSSSYYVFGANGMIFNYVTALPDEDLTVSDKNQYGKAGSALHVTWKTGYENTNLFSSATYGGCGSYSGPNVVTADLVGPESKLIAIGTTEGGDILFLPKNLATHQLTKNIYDEWYPLGGDGTKPDINVFVKEKIVPFFLWKDGFGRWIEYKDAAVQPIAECGKPVVYLYPPATTPVHVELPSFIHVSKSEPSYPAHGWDVIAQPNGMLTNSDGTSWSNLYWDGTGVNYPAARDGFVVRDGEVAKFFVEILPKYGLNAQEAKDFTDFWIPYFSGANYYRISFLTSEWSKAAPMNVSPRPQTSIRIYMDWQKLSAPVSIAAPKIATPSREGFTLVEWGGAIPR